MRDCGPSKITKNVKRERKQRIYKNMDENGILEERKTR